MISATFKVTDPHGLHMRPSMQLVTALKEFDDCTFCLEINSGSTWSKEITIGLMALAVAGIGFEETITVNVKPPFSDRSFELIPALATLSFLKQI